jgi:uncharacterized protein
MNSGVLFGNKILDVVTISMLAVQIYKLVSSTILEKKFVWKRFFETGGMPSSHTSSVTALVTAIGFSEGIQSSIFAISVVFAVIVMYDAAGIRKAAGQHAGILNQITDFFSISFDKKFKHEKLKELLGHSRLEVLIGAITGIAIALLFRGYLLK